MHIRFSTTIGTPVFDEGIREHIGMVQSILIHPDSGAVEGFFCTVGGVVGAQILFLSSQDIIRWGTAVSIRSVDVLGPVDDRVRLQPLLHDPRRVLGQMIRTEGGKKIGVCKDVQFSTKSWRVEWLFPKRWFRWRIALPITDVIEVTTAAIIVKDSEVSGSQPIEDESLSVLEEISEVAEKGVPRPTTRSSL